MTMIRRAFYLGLAVASAWQLVSAVNRYRLSARKAQEREAVQAWETEGGNPAPVRRRAVH